jgi:hypothetical protein
MDSLEHRAPPSHRAYIWSGLGLGLLSGVFGMGSRGFAQFELLNLVGGGAAGTVIGSMMFRTRLWRRDNYAVQALRLSIALCVAALTLSDIALFAKLQTVAESRQVLAFAPGFSLGFGWAIWAREFNDQRLKPTRRDIGVLLGVGVLSLAWALAVIRLAPTGAV